MRTARLFSLWLATAFFACASNGALSPTSSMQVLETNELHECTELVRGLMLANTDLEAAGDVASIRENASAKICQQRVDAANKRADDNAWWARWGAPMGAGIMALVMGGLTALIVGIQ